MPVLLVTGDRAHVVLLVDQRHDGPAHLHIVEGRLEEVETQDTLAAQRVDIGNDDILALREDGQEIDGRLLVPIGLAGTERRRGGGGIGDIEPLHPVDLDDLAARGKARRFLAR